MSILFFMVFGIAAFGGNFIKINIAGVSFTYLTMFGLCISYFHYFILKKGIISLDKQSKILMTFEIYAALLVCLSLVSLNKIFVGKDLYTNIVYIPRQAYYLAIIPAIILMREERYIKNLFRVLNQYGTILFWFILLIHIIFTQSFSTSVPTTLILAFLALYSNGNRWTKHSILKFIVISFMPIAIGGEMTNVIIRGIYAFLFIYRFHEENSVRILRLLFCGMLSCIFILPLFTTIFQSIFDANSFWRLAYWQDELTQLVKSNFIGVGYGTSYATREFAGINIVGGPFAATAEYSMIDKLFVTGPHCSYVALAFRTGVVGISLFLYFMFSVISIVEKNIKFIPLYAIFLLFSSSILIGVNVGLESPYYLFVFVFSIGLCFNAAFYAMRKSYDYKKKYY